MAKLIYDRHPTAKLHGPLRRFGDYTFKWIAFGLAGELLTLQL
jgi:hypothetical protein